MAEVWLAEDTRGGRTAGSSSVLPRVAVKILRRELTRQRDQVTRFLAEATTLEELRHPNVVRVLLHGRLGDGRPYQVMELLRGETLASRLERQTPWPAGRILHVAIQLARALSAAHQRGIIHRDLKPENVFLVEKDGDRDHVKLLDFGVAKDLAQPQQLTADGATVGTPFYMSPEQCMGRPDIDERADVYGLGVLLYQMCTGQLPYSSTSWIEVMALHMSAPFPLLRAARPELPPALEACVMRAVQKQPDDRWPTMAALRQELEVLQESLEAVFDGRPTDPERRPSALPAASAPRPSAELLADEEMTVRGCDTGLPAAIMRLPELASLAEAAEAAEEETRVQPQPGIPATRMMATTPPGGIAPPAMLVRRRPGDAPSWRWTWVAAGAGLAALLTAIALLVYALR
jgi:serine/threonine-protein kinase